MFGLESTHFAKRLLREKVTDLVVSLDIGDGITPGRFSNRVLIDHFDLGKVIDIAFDGFMEPDLFARLAFYLLQGWVEYLFDERGLAATANAADYTEDVEREFDGQVP